MYNKVAFNFNKLKTRSVLENNVNHCMKLKNAHCHSSAIEEYCPSYTVRVDFMSAGVT